MQGFGCALRHKGKTFCFKDLRKSKYRENRGKPTQLWMDGCNASSLLPP
jgi:hypothetical protein